MRGFVGTSNASDIENAISEAPSGLRNADLPLMQRPVRRLHCYLRDIHPYL